MKGEFQLWLEHTDTRTPQIVDSRAAYFAAKKDLFSVSGIGEMVTLATAMVMVKGK